MKQELIWKLATWMSGLAAGFLLGGSMARGDDFFGYLSGLMLLLSGILFVFVKSKELK